MTAQHLTHEFKAFLYRNNAYKGFFKAYREQNPTYSFANYLKDTLSRGKGSDNLVSIVGDLISGSIYWSKTKEGLNYWREINMLWERYCRNLELDGILK